ncbi:hypothetical protein ACKUB1_09565 [Methanospirillum stamsii]|uniref:Uncharacterized protein n=1 Tax=Methanospirillum stamsii TaxID=1277351 RepID=A0A2V2N9G1_9EURY|nr:hypothetical protein [Methanospirillum stamsii]PWR75360.1 hypothetical protein DLD82_04285 [Methanospirillum stamsii]
MSSIYSTTTYEIVNDHDFNHLMRKYVAKWRHYLEDDHTPDYDIERAAVNLAFRDVLEYHPEVLIVTATLEIRRPHADRIIAQYHARETAPGAFRAMFAEA